MYQLKLDERWAHLTRRIAAQVRQRVHLTRPDSQSGLEQPKSHGMHRHELAGWILLRELKNLLNKLV